MFLGGVLVVVVTGSITTSGGDRRQFWQTFFLSRQYQYKDGYNYFVRNEILRFLNLPEVVQVHDVWRVLVQCLLGSQRRAGSGWFRVC